MGKKRNEAKHGRLNDKNHDPKINFSLSIPSKLLQKIEENIKGDSRSEKVCKCVELGYLELTNPTVERKL